MKKLAAIFFLLVVVFNFYGYRLLISYMQYENQAAIEKKVDACDYRDEELVSVKTTLHLPYYTGSDEYERTYGSITIGGVEYEYVKRRVYQDTLELLCLPNHEKTKLQKVNNELTQLAAEGQSSAPEKKSTTVKIGLPDFVQAFQNGTSPIVLHKEKEYFHSDLIFFAPGFPGLQEKPPKSMHA